MSAKSQRLGRIEGEMQRVLSTLVSREVRDPRVGNVTITTVSVAPDMSTARIFFVPFASKHTPEEVMEGLNRASGFLRGALGRALSLRHAPKLEFIYDQQIENADKLTRLIDGAVKSDQHEPDDSSRTSSACRTASSCSTSPRASRRTARCSACARHIGAASAGHVGTLDPMATGMLPLCLDEATKVIAEIESGAKCYEFTVQLGARTDTGDAEGQVVEEQPVPPLDAAAHRSGARAVSAARSQQVPPMYSALKREGRPLYELARQGIEVERAARTIEIRQLELARRSGPTRCDLLCECAKGTYIRVLGEDIARALGTCGHLIQLRRTWVEPFREHAHGLARSGPGRGGASERLLPPDAALQRLARRPGSRPSRSARCGMGRRWCGSDRSRAGAGRRVRALRSGGGVPGPGRAAARWPAAAAAPDAASALNVSLGFAGPFL